METGLQHIKKSYELYLTESTMYDIEKHFGFTNGNILYRSSSTDNGVTFQ